MTVFMVERNLKGIEPEGLAAAQQAAIAMAEKHRASGKSVRYIRSMFAPEDGRCMCLFEADHASEVVALNDEANLPYTNVVQALDLTPR